MAPHTNTSWPKSIGRCVLGVVLGLVPASLIAALLWYFSSGVEGHELPGSSAYGTFIVLSWWMGVAIGVMVAVMVSQLVLIGVVAGVLSAVPLMIVDTVGAGSAERLQALGSAQGWVGALMAVALPAAIGLLFSMKRLEHMRQLGGTDYRMPG